MKFRDWLLVVGMLMLLAAFPVLGYVGWVEGFSTFLIAVMVLIWQAGMN